MARKRRIQPNPFLEIGSEPYLPPKQKHRKIKKLKPKKRVKMTLGTLGRL